MTQAKLPVCPNSGIVSRRFTANGGKTVVDPINFSFARLGQKVIDASFFTLHSFSLAIFLYSTTNNEIRYTSSKMTCIDTKSIIYTIVDYSINYK